MPEWANVLQAYTMGDLARGIERFQASPGKFPPGAGDFAKACREFQPGTFAGNASPPRRADRTLEHRSDEAMERGREVFRLLRERLDLQSKLPPAERMKASINARMDILHEEREEAKRFLRDHLPNWINTLEGDALQEALSVLDERR